jgi:branched-chain amino acid transport system substrate-binding protein
MDAIARAGSTDAEKIRAALRNTNYDAPNGKYKFTDKGQAYGFSLVLVQIDNKTPKVVASAAVDEPR